MTEVVVISSDSSNPTSPVTCITRNRDERSPLTDSSPSERRKQSISMRKRPNHNFSSSDDSDNESFSYVKNKITAPKPTTKEACHNLSEGDNSDIEFCPIEETKTLRNSPIYKVKDLGEDLLDPDDSKKSYNFESEKRKMNICKRKAVCEETRERRLKEKEEKKLEKAREKALKKAASESQKANRPGECIKNIQAVLDQKLLTEEYGGDILLALQGAQMQHNIQDQLCEKSITWIKTVNEYHCDDNMEIIVRKNTKEENLILVVMTSNELVELVQLSRLRRHMQNIALQHEGKKLILIIYKLEEFYRLQNVEKQRKFKAQCRVGATENQRTVGDHKITRSEVERALIEIQIFEECSHRFVETCQNLGSLVVQFTKALAEKVFKLEKQQKEQEKLEWFASGDSRDTVKVDKNGNGLIRLWKQQICQFSNASIDTAEAIVSLYSSPKSLIQTYENCSTQKGGQQLLQDITVRRAAGPLTSVRRVGPELSKKMYTFFTAKQGDLSLSQD